MHWARGSILTVLPFVHGRTQDSVLTVGIFTSHSISCGRVPRRVRQKFTTCTSIKNATDHNRFACSLTHSQRLRQQTGQDWSPGIAKPSRLRSWHSAFACWVSRSWQWYGRHWLVSQSNPCATVVNNGTGRPASVSGFEVGNAKAESVL